MVFRRKKRRKPSFVAQKWDPLFIIFEKHLYDFNYESRDLFVKGVVSDYLTHLLRQQVLVPPAWRLQLEKSLAEEVGDMLVRRLYGCLTVEELKLKTEDKVELVTAKREARKRYQKLAG